MAKKEQTPACEQRMPFDKQHTWLFFLFVVGLPLLTHHILQFFYVGWERNLRYNLYTDTGETVFAMLLGCFDVVINFLKSLNVFVALGLLAVRMTRAYGSRLTKIGMISLPFALLLPYLASYWLAEVFQGLNSLTTGYLTLMIIGNWLLDLAVVGLGIWVISARRAKIWKREELDPKKEWLPRRSNVCLRTAWFVTLSSLAVRLCVCIVTTVTDLLSVGGPSNFEEVFTLIYPYLLLAAEHAVGYLVIAQILRSAQDRQPIQEKPFSRPWMLKKK